MIGQFESCCNGLFYWMFLNQFKPQSGKCIFYLLNKRFVYVHHKLCLVSIFLETTIVLRQQFCCQQLPFLNYWGFFTLRKCGSKRRYLPVVSNFHFCPVEQQLKRKQRAEVSCYYKRTLVLIQWHTSTSTERRKSPKSDNTIYIYIRYTNAFY